MPLAPLDLTGHPVATVPRGTPLVLGRAVECDVTLTDPTISRRHAELRADDGVLLVRDLGSRNGTFHNGQRLDEVAVRAGAAVTFGALTLHVADSPDPRAQVHADAAAWYAAAAAGQARPSERVAQPVSEAVSEAGSE